MFGRLAQEFPRLAGWHWFERFDGLLGRFRARGIRWAVMFLMGLGLVYGSGMVVNSWRACSKAMNYLVLGRSTLPVARFLEARKGQDIFLAYWRSFEIRPALTNPHARIVAIHARADDDVASLMGSLYESGVTHLAIDRKIMDPIGKRGRLLGEVKNRLLAAPDSAWLAEDAGRVKLFRVPPTEYWHAEGEIGSGPRRDEGMSESLETTHPKAGETTNVIPR